MMIPSFDPRWTASSLTASIYEWVRNYLGLTPLRVNCSTPCWMSDAAWTEWKNYSRPHFNYVAWLPESTPFCVFKSTTLGTRSLFASAVVQREMNSLVLKNVRRLRTSKSLTSDVLNALLTRSSVSATKPSRRFVYECVAYPTSGRTSSPWSRSASSSLPWSDEFADPLQDIRDWVQYVKECYELYT